MLAKVWSKPYQGSSQGVHRSVEERHATPYLQMGSMQLQMGASAATEAMMADNRGCASRMVCRACRAEDRCSLRRCASSVDSCELTPTSSAPALIYTWVGALQTLRLHWHLCSVLLKDGNPVDEHASDVAFAGKFMQPDVVSCFAAQESHQHTPSLLGSSVWAQGQDPCSYH